MLNPKKHQMWKNEVFNDENSCPCGSNNTFSSCCFPFLNAEKWPLTPEQLMRSRYSAFVKMKMDYLLKTTHPSTRKYYTEASIRNWANQCKWVDLTILEAKGNTVKFNARFIDEKGNLQEHKEFSTFQKVNNKWFFVDGQDWE